MIIDSSALEKNTVIKSEVCIIGGGVAGITLANELKKSFNKITLIESGGETFNLEIQNLYSPESLPELYPDPTWSRMRYLGGSSNHWENSTNPLDPIDFERRDWVANSGWPISYEDVAIYYPKAGDYCGVGNDGYNLEDWLNKLNRKDQFSKSLDITTSVSKGAIPPTRFFDKFKNELINNPFLTIYTNANLTDIDFDPESGNVQFITFKSAPDIKHSVTAKVFVICLGGIENARLMLEFNEKYNNALGNQHDNVGRFFMDHPIIRGAHLYPFNKSDFDFYKGSKLKSRYVHGNVKLRKATLYKNRINNMRIPFKDSTRYFMSHGISSAHILSSSFQDLETPEYFGRHLMNIVKDIDLVTESISRKTFDSEVFDDSDEFGGFLIESMIEQTPDRNNRITLGEKTDPYNIRRINIDWKVSEDDKNSAWQALDVLAKDVGKLSIGRLRVLKERESRVWASQMGFGHHHIGTTRMASDPKQGVVDKDQKIFGSNNFYISGSSVFPTGGHVPPTLTIVALTIRLANHIIDRYRS